MNIVKLNGEDDELYRRVARLVMDKDVLASNNNYPFKTSASHIWFVAYDENDTTTGFIPVAVRNRNASVPYSRNSTMYTYRFPEERTAVCCSICA